MKKREAKGENIRKKVTRRIKKIIIKTGKKIGKIRINLILRDQLCEREV